MARFQERGCQVRTKAVTLVVRPQHLYGLFENAATNERIRQRMIVEERRNST